MKADIALVDDHGATVQKMFDRIAPGYDRANRVMSLGTDERWRKRAVASLLAHEPRGVGLDLCAGTLDSTLAIHRAFPEARLIAGDFAGEMLEHGKKKLVGAAADRIETLQMDAHALPLADASVDGIFCAFGIRNLSDLDRGTQEQARVLRDGGRLVVLEFFRPTRWLTRVVHVVYNETLLPIVGWAITGDREAYRYLPRSIGKFDDVASYRERLTRAGFDDITVEELTLGVACIVRATKRREPGSAGGRA